ncbi:MAG: Crp/Fnr family transcriptional regulator [Alphaproteobacteria bacterium]|nr:MAG: Crp/Fnr family transcriptional regulator [Alphaproteobacteria bacterium]
MIHGVNSERSRPTTASPQSESLPRARELLCSTCLGRSIGICAPLDDQRLAHLLSLGRRQRWNKGQLMFQAGDPMGYFYKVTKGIALIFRSLQDGRRQIVGVHSIGDLCGYLEKDATYNFSGVALTDVEACSFHRRRFDDLVARNPDLGSALANDMSDKLKRAAEHMAVLGQLKSTERVAYFLLQLAEVYNRKMAQSEPLQLHLTREQIADHLGLRLETVSRSFTVLKNNRLIGLVGSDAVAILDRRRLAEFARLGTV